MNYWPLLGIAVVVVGFVLRLNPIAVVVAAGLASGLLAGKPLGESLALLGESFVSNRALMLFVLTLPTIGLLERAGLREHMHAWIVRLRGDARTPAHRLPRPAPVAEHVRPDRHRRARRRCGRCWRPWPSRPRKKRRQDRRATATGNPRPIRGDRQRRSFFGEDVFRLRRGAADPGLLRAERHRARTLHHRAVGVADRRWPRSSSIRCGSCCSRAHAARSAAMLELARSTGCWRPCSATAAWRNARERRTRRPVSGRCWRISSPAATGSSPRARPAILLPAQLAGVGVIALAVLALRMRPRSIEEAPREQRPPRRRSLGHRLLWRRC